MLKELRARVGFPHVLGHSIIWQLPGFILRLMFNALHPSLTKHSCVTSTAITWDSLSSLYILESSARTQRDFKVFSLSSWARVNKELLIESISGRPLIKKVNFSESMKDLKGVWYQIGLY